MTIGKIELGHGKNAVTAVIGGATKNKVMAVIGGAAKHKVMAVTGGTAAEVRPRKMQDRECSQ